MALGINYSFKITIYPVLTNVNFLQQLIKNQEVTIDQVRKQGSYLLIDNNKIDNIEFIIDPINQTTKLSYLGNPITIQDSIYIDSFKTSNGLFNTKLNNTIRIIAQTNNGYYNLDSVLIDAFRANDFMSIELVDPITQTSQPLCKGIISSPIGVTYDSNGLNIVINIENYMSYLDRIDLIQIRNDQYNLKSNSIISPLSAQVYKFGDFFTKLLSETLIPLGIPTLYYQKGLTDNKYEIIGGKSGSDGTAIGSNTSLYFPTTPTQSKLNAIKETLYPTHKVFWCDNYGNFQLTPLQTYFNPLSNWTFTLNEEYGKPTNNTDILISLSNIEVSTNTATIYNRVIDTLFGINILLNNTSAGTSLYQNSIAIATVQDKGTNAKNNGKTYFPRFVDLYNSTKAFITSSEIQEVNNDTLQNAGFLNLVSSKFQSIQGLKSVYTINDNSAELKPTLKGGPDFSKSVLPLYACKKLAEGLFNDKLINIRFDMNLAYNNVGTDDSPKGFKTIPLGEMVKIPTVSNSLFDYQDQMFCYGYEFNFTRNSGAVCTLMLCKPHTYTALWCDRADVFDSTPLGL